MNENTTELNIHRLMDRLEAFDSSVVYGHVREIVGLTIEAMGPLSNVGEVCEIDVAAGERLEVETVGFSKDRTLLMPLGEMAGIGPGCRVYATGKSLRVGVGPNLLGRVLDGLGRPMDGLGTINSDVSYDASRPPPKPLDRPPIENPLSIGIRVIDGLLTCGRGQRLGIFAGSGVGKSTLLGMIAKNTEADVNVIALVGERGREVREFIERDLGQEGLGRSCVVVATSDQPPLVRIKAALVATAIAEYFRDQGNHVVFMMDSVTRFAMAQREVGLASGEPPATRGYTPSVFALLPRLLERTGADKHGTITGFYTVLVDGDDMNEPISDAIRGTLDGHIVLSRELAAAGHYPAIDVLQSVSRVMPAVCETEHVRRAAQMKAAIATYREAEDLINIGAYAKGSNPRIDSAVSLIGDINSYLRQGVDERTNLMTSVAELDSILGFEGCPF